MSNYKVFFYPGDELGLTTKVEKGFAFIDETELRIQAASPLSIPLREITATKLFRLHGLGRVVQIDHSGGRLFVSVVRLLIGQFAFINFAKTGDLHERLTALATNRVS